MLLWLQHPKHTRGARVAKRRASYVVRLKPPLEGGSKTAKKTVGYPGWGFVPLVANSVIKYIVLLVHVLTQEVQVDKHWLERGGCVSRSSILSLDQLASVRYFRAHVNARKKKKLGSDWPEQKHDRGGFAFLSRAKEAFFVVHPDERNPKILFSRNTKRELGSSGAWAGLA